eukprot:3928809-Pyramimonas_sp.AAC.1
MRPAHFARPELQCMIRLSLVAHPAFVMQLAKIQSACCQATSYAANPDATARRDPIAALSA